MIETLTDLARGPLLKLSLLIMAAGLLRAFVLQIWELGSAWGRAGDQVVPWPAVIKRSLVWLLPWRYLGPEARRLYNFTSFVFHVGIILVPVGLAGHVALWEEGLGIAWITLPPVVADWLTVLTIVAILGLLIGRSANEGSRKLSKAQDWILPVLCLLPFISGFLTAHPRFSPVNWPLVYLVHLLSGELLLILVPFTKLVHIVLFWSNRSSSEFGWRFSPGSGERVRATLGREAHGV